MIRSVEVRGFKRFSHEVFNFAPLTVLTGLNGSGKTSVIQSLVIAYEASTSRDNALRLNGPLGLQLGTAEDVLNWNTKPPIEIAIQADNSPRAEWRFDISSPDALFLGIASRPGTPPPTFAGQPRAFTYLSAERLGPRSHSATSPVPDHQLEVGVQGEHCAHVISVLGSKVLEDADRRYPFRTDEESALLKYEVEQWLAQAVRPVEITSERLPGSSIVRCTFRSPGGEWVTAPNMGFGVSYALPIILGGLIAKAGGLLVVENPEAHLHPAGQSRMGLFLAWLASRGVQVVMETHSDHVLNGVRLAIAQHGFLPSTDALAYFFGEDTPPDQAIKSEQLLFSETGGISHWPSGFFDQYQIDVASLGRIRRRR